MKKTGLKLLSLILCLALGFGLVGTIPNSKYKVEAATTTAIEANSGFSIQNMPESINFNTTLDFYDYLVGAVSNVQVIVYRPNGEIAKNWTNVDGIGTSAYTFVNMGLHCVQYRLLSNAFYTYSSYYYINVENTVSGFTFTGLVPTYAKAGTEITIPDYDTYSVKVFTPYGNEVTVTDKKFTNENNILGTYYIEYSKTISVGSTTETLRSYKTVTFKPEYTKPANCVINLGSNSNDISASENGFYIYRNYNLYNASVVDENEAMIDSNIEVSVFDETRAKYYNFATGNFDSTTEIAVNINTNPTFSENDVISNLGFADANADGHTYNFNYKATNCYGDTIIKSLSLSSKFNVGAISIVPVTPVPTYGVLTVVASGTVLNETLTSINLPKVKIEVDNLYDETKYLNLISGQSLSVLSNEVTYESNDYTPSQTGVEQTLNNYVFHYRAEEYSTRNVTLTYTVNYDALFGSKTKAYTLPLINSGTEYDTVKPNTIKIDDFESVIVVPSGLPTVNFIIPNATASDLDNNGNSTNGSTITVSLDDTATAYELNSTIALSAGRHKLTYKATDTSNNIQSKNVYVEVINEDNIALQIDNSKFSASVETDELDVEVTFTKDDLLTKFFDTAMIFTNDKCGFSPVVEYDNLGINKFSFVLEDATTNYVVSLALTTKLNTTYYFGISINANNNVTNPSPIKRGLYKDLNTVYLVAENDVTVNAKVGQTVAFYGPNTKQVEGEGLYTCIYIDSNATIMQILVGGTYNINCGTNNYTIVVDDDKECMLDFYNVPKQVTKKSSIVELTSVYAKEYFGYTLSQKVYDLDNNELVVNGINVSINSVNNFEIENTLEQNNGKKETKVFKLVSGNMQVPVITISAVNEDCVLKGTSYEYEIKSAVAIDKNGNKIDTITVKLIAPSGTEVVKNENGKYNLTESGNYTIYYTAVDSDGLSTTESVSFSMSYDIEKDEALNGWQIFGIVAGSVVGIALISLIVILIVKSYKKKNKFIKKSKNKLVKETSKKTSNGNKIYSVAPSKDGKHYFVKSDNKMLYKTETKDDAIAKLLADKKAKGTLKVYSNTGRLIDTIDVNK